MPRNFLTSGAFVTAKHVVHQSHTRPNIPICTDHLIQQGAIAGVLARLCGASPLGVASAFALAGLPNTVPDLWPLVKGLLDPKHPNVEKVKVLGINFPYRWDVYNNLHFVDMRWWTYTWRLHLVVDKPFHAQSPDWWRTMKAEAVFMWGLELILLFLCFG